jgi:adenosylhomocysteinase
MDVALAAQALAAEYAVHNAMALERRVYAVPRAVDRELAGVLLSTMGIEIDQLTEAQARYLATWDEGA